MFLHLLLLTYLTDTCGRRVENGRTPSYEDLKVSLLNVSGT